MGLWQESEKRHLDAEMQNKTILGMALDDMEQKAKSLEQEMERRKRQREVV
jgi:hypothetical protein